LADALTLPRHAQTDPSCRLEAHHSSGEPVLANAESRVAWVDEQIAEPQREINDHIDGHPELKQDAELIASIPGIGEARETLINLVRSP
jgi:hypothetical protein